MRYCTFPKEGKYVYPEDQSIWYRTKVWVSWYFVCGGDLLDWSCCFEHPELHPKAPLSEMRLRKLIGFIVGYIGVFFNNLSEYLNPISPEDEQYYEEQHEEYERDIRERLSRLGPITDDDLQGYKEKYWQYIRKNPEVWLKELENGRIHQ